MCLLLSQSSLTAKQGLQVVLCAKIVAMNRCSRQTGLVVVDAAADVVVVVGAVAVLAAAAQASVTVALGVAVAVAVVVDAGEGADAAVVVVVVVEVAEEKCTIMTTMKTRKRNRKMKT